MKRFFLSLTILFFIGGCCACRKGSPVIGNLESTLWTMIELNDKAVADTITISFDPSSKTITGGCDCNKIYAGYHLFEKEQGNIEFLNPGFKVDGCPENPKIQEFVTVLSSVSTVKIEAGHLLLIDASQNIVAIFKQ